MSEQHTGWVIQLVTQLVTLHFGDGISGTADDQIRSYIRGLLKMSTEELIEEMKANGYRVVSVGDGSVTLEGGVQ